MKNCLYSICALILFVGSGCSGTKNSTVIPHSWESLQATLWVQHAAEYDALTLGFYQAAENNIEPLLQDSSFTAIPGQSIEPGKKPPAIIMDVDETILDNSPFQARLIRNKMEFTPDLWAKWVNEENAVSVPGALDFTQRAYDNGITVFYLTNRDHLLESATRNNLSEIGFPIKQIDSTSEVTDVILTKGEQENWTSSKTSRRKLIAENYRVIMIFGDNLNDFIAAEGKSEKERMKLLEKYGEYFGSSWFMLPNPVYGSWESSMMKSYENEIGQNEIIQRKIELLLPEY